MTRLLNNKAFKRLAPYWLYELVWELAGEPEDADLEAKASIPGTTRQ